MADFVLDGTSARVELGQGFTIRAPGVTANGRTTEGPRAFGTRSAAAQESAALDAALAASNMTEVKQVELEEMRVSGPTGSSGTRAANGDDALELEVPVTGPERSAVVLSVTDGVMTWILPVNATATAPTTGGTRGGGGSTLLFRIPNAAPPQPAAGTAGTRGLIGGIGRKLLKVLVYPVTDPILGPIGEHFAAKWEAKNRPYGVRTFTPENYQTAGAGAFTQEDWARMAAGRSLLFIHGTFSTAHGGFHQLPKATLAMLHEHYGGRVFAFNHPSLSADPPSNATWFFEQMKAAGITLDCDIICHSRGGLVSRAIVERSTTGTGVSEDDFRVGAVVFVGTPNAGTLLAQPDHMMSMIDRYTTALNVLPAGPVEEILEAIICTVKLVAHAVMKALDGLMSMNPEGDYLKLVNKPGNTSTRYYAIAANFEPNTPGSAPLRTLIKQKVGDAMVDRIFKDAHNDLVVPTDGVFTAGGPTFPLGESSCLIFPSDRAIWHSAYFEQPETTDRLKRWLTQPV